MELKDARLLPIAALLHNLISRQALRIDQPGRNGNRLHFQCDTRLDQNPRLIPY
ncbi:hypothetical protein LJR220_001510 [Bradyrhizobium sp. LjRoot220]|uniref:hypothetical protein n=1 Tax=Bradyrhizobium sp. LjRoot220 TaxID=3342284 RepID=UPI003ECFC4B1